MEVINDILREIRPDIDFSSSVGFIEAGLIDSFDMVELISVLEERFGIVIDGLDIVPENFESVEAIATLVEKSGGRL